MKAGGRLGFLSSLIRPSTASHICTFHEPLQTADEVLSLGPGRDVGESMETKLRSLGLNGFNFQPDLPLGFLDVEVTRTSLDTNKWVPSPVGQECLQRA